MCVDFESVRQHFIFDDFHLQISKTQNGCQNVKKPPYFLWFLANEITIYKRVNLNEKIQNCRDIHLHMSKNKMAVKMSIKHPFCICGSIMLN